MLPVIHYREIICGTLKGKEVNGTYVISNYKQKIGIKLGDYVVLFGKERTQRRSCSGTVVRIRGQRIELDTGNGIIASVCADSAGCILKM